MKKITNEIKIWSYSIVFSIIIYLIIIPFAQLGLINGKSMETTFSGGNRVIIYKHPRNLEVNDIVTFTYTQTHEDYFQKEMSRSNIKNVPDNSFLIDEQHVKRIFGLPGDEIEIKKSSEIFINGEHVFTNSYFIPIQNYILEENTYFLLGDNQDNSYDSRLHGPITIEEICGIIITNK